MQEIQAIFTKISQLQLNSLLFGFNFSESEDGWIFSFFLSFFSFFICVLIFTLFPSFHYPSILFSTSTSSMFYHRTIALAPSSTSSSFIWANQNTALV